MGPIGMQEMIVIFLVALVLFGPKKLPELGKNLAKGLAEFKKAQSELKATFDREMHNLERETASARDAMTQSANEIASYSHVDDSGSSNSTYHEQLLETAHSAAAHEVSELPTVSASEVSSAESHAEPASLQDSLHSATGTPVLTPTEGTVSRGSIKPAAIEANPLPEFGHVSEPGTRPESSSELPSLV